MLNRKNLLTFAALFSGLFIYLSAPEKTAAQKAPPGSYRETCTEIRLDGTTLTARCKPKADDTAWAPSKLYEVDRCVGDIANWDGKLRCTKSKKVEPNEEIIERAFMDVYNYGAGSKELAYYLPQKITYAGVVAAERDKLNDPKSKVIRRLMILAAYKKTFGRAPNNAEYDYWTPKTEIFKELVAANRAYLYAPNGAKDLTETVKRRLKVSGIENPSIAEINGAIVKFSKTKAIFDEMQ